MDLSEYPHEVKPFAHQKKHLSDHARTKAWGLLWEQGTAKTKPTIDTIAYNFMIGEIDGAMVVAPPGVERNWASDEIPAHLPQEISLDTRVQIFKTEKKHTQTHKRQMQALLDHEGLAILLISYAAFLTKEGKAMTDKFLRRRRAIMVLDESHNIKSPGAKRSLSLRAQGKKAKMRRILTGTPIGKGPFDLYSQIAFLDEWFWKNKGIQGATEFRHYFGKYLMRADHIKLHGYDPGYDQLLGYKNLDKLKMWLAEISDRVVKDDVLDLPPKLYQKRYFPLPKQLRDAYEQLGEELMLEVGDNVIFAELPIVKLLRLQQITCNYVPVGEDEPVHQIMDKNPRMQVMEELRDQMQHKCIVWARFRHDIDQIMDCLGPKAVRYDGTLTDDEAERSKNEFQKGDADFFVGTAAKGGPGLTLHQAKTVIYYSNSFNLIERLQSEDRAHRAGMDDNPVNYIDIVADDTVDEHIVKNLRNKRDIATDIQGDELKEWI